MKRFMLVVVLFVCTTFAYSQKSICGVDFGSSYESAKSILERKFGKADGDKKDEICSLNREYEGFKFNGILFTFQSDGYNTYFNDCFFFKKFMDFASAKEFSRNLFIRLAEKYDNIKTAAFENFVGAMGGKSPVSDNDFGFFLVTEKDNIGYTVTLEYGPYNYIKEEF